MRYNFSFTPRLTLVSLICAILALVLVYAIGIEVGRRMANEEIEYITECSNATTEENNRPNNFTETGVVHTKSSEPQTLEHPPQSINSN